MKKLMLLTGFIFFSFMLMAQEDFRLTKNKIQISGTSTLHDWKADVNKSQGSAALVIENGVLKSIANLSITMESKSIKSEKGSGMDKNIYKALKTDKYPAISFALTKVTSITAKGSGYDILAQGNLTIAGTTQAVSIAATGQKSSNGDITFKGSKKLKMTDYKVEPPVLFLGTLKTGDEVTITFETIVSPVNGLSQK